MGRRRRHRHSAEFKAMVIGECMRPGVSMAAVALEHSLNANLLRKWVIDAKQAGPRAPTAPAVSQEVRTPAPTFIPLALTAPPAEGEIRIELQRSRTTVKVVWPAAAAAE